MSNEQSPRSGYVPFDEREIEMIRACLDDGTYTKQEQKDIGKLCDMAINSLLYAEEIHRLRDAPRSGRGANDAVLVPRKTLERWQDEISPYQVNAEDGEERNNEEIIALSREIGSLLFEGQD